MVERSNLVVSLLQVVDRKTSHIAFGVLLGTRHAFFPVPKGATIETDQVLVLIAKTDNPSLVDALRPLHIEIAAINGGSGSRTALLKLQSGGRLNGPPTPGDIRSEALTRLKSTGDIMATLATFGFTPVADESTAKRMAEVALPSGLSDQVWAAPAAITTVRDVGSQDAEQILDCYFSDSCGVNPDTHVPDPVDE